MEELWARKREYGRAAELFEQANSYQRAADCYHHKDAYIEAAAMLRKGKLYDQLVLYLSS